MKDNKTIITTDIIKYLYERDLIAQITNEKKLRSILQSKSIILYCGFDPTSDSLHIGHLILLLCLKKFQIFGHHPLILIGGATGLIGDPSFKDSERILNSLNNIQKWIKKIKSQVSLFIDCNNNIKKPCIINNYTWFSDMKILTFLREIGKFFSINKMINKDIIKKRLKKNNQGISYTEFSYNLMQSYDFLYLYKNYGVILQIGGSDQWSNIVSGIDLIKRVYKKPAYGLTIPLLTNTDNIKFGKTEKSTIWLDPKKTSPYKFYQYWINIDDSKVHHFLKIFTDIDIKKINLLKKVNNFNYVFKDSRIKLAEKITRLVHGETGLNIAQRITENLFSKDISKLTEDDFYLLSKDDSIPNLILTSEITLQQALVESKLAISRSQARYFIKNKAVTINTNTILKTEYTFKESDRLYNHYTLLKRGKKNYCLLQWKNI